MDIHAAGSRPEWLTKALGWIRRHPRWTLTAMVLLLLGPYLAKPFNIDDPLFIWSARQIQAHPADPYGFPVDWVWSWSPMSEITQNPPLACYYLALAAGLLGWSELAIHAAFLVPALAAILGTYRLACRFCGHPVLAALATLCTPAFLVSGLTVMCDMTMLASWVWAVVFWVEGTEETTQWKLFVAAALIVLAEWSKYFGICLVPLLAAYSLAAREPWKRWVQFLLLPLALLLAYQLVTRAMYGTSLLFHAVNYTSGYKNILGFTFTQNCLTALAFTGGCAAAAAMFAPWLWRVRTVVVFLLVAAAVCGVFFAGEAPWSHYSVPPGARRVAVEVQIGFWVAVGLSLVALAVADFWQRRDRQSCLLALWLIGTFSFTALINWTINGRSILPLIPAAGILIVRRLETRKVFHEPGEGRPVPAPVNPSEPGLRGQAVPAPVHGPGAVYDGAWPRGVVIALTASLLLAVAVLQADCSTAFAIRQNAWTVCADCRDRLASLWFQGHWGFQYYMSLGGATPVDFKHPNQKPGDAMAVPTNNSNIRPLTRESADLAAMYNTPGAWLVSTTDQTLGAGFYASALGPLPFAFGAVKPETVSVYILKPTPQ
jgi:4-amino-4-deoxy-L-arabinose transferase-like glycosyltransferase